MKNLLKTNALVNYGVRCLLAACSGSFMGSAIRLVVESEQKTVDKIVVAAGGLVTAWVVGNALDEPFNKMLEEGEFEDSVRKDLEEFCENRLQKDDAEET